MSLLVGIPVEAEGLLAVGQSCTSPPLSRMARRRPPASATAWTLLLRPPRERPITRVCSPFSTRGRAVRLDVGGIDHLHPGRAPACGKLAKQPLPHAAPRPAHEAIVDRRRWPVLRRAIAPSAAAFREVQDAADDASVIDTFLATHIGWQKRGDPRPLMIIQPKQVASHVLCCLEAENHRPGMASMYLTDAARRRRVKRSTAATAHGSPMPRRLGNGTTSD